MERSHRPIVLLAALLGLFALGFWIHGRGEDRPALDLAPAVSNPAAESQFSGMIDDPSPAETVIETRRSLAVGRGDELPTAVSANYDRGVPEPLPGARVRLRLIDAVSHAPIAGLGFEVYRERGGDRVLAEGETDEEGLAEIEDVEPNAVLFRTEYKPPYARSFAGLWLNPGDERELTIEVGRGGRITGRLVDPKGRPVAGLQIDREGQRGEIPVSDEAGRFEVLGVSPTPKSVWIKADGMKPERFHNMSFRVVDPPYFVASFGASPEPGETVDVGDVQVKARVRIRGRVVNEEGEPQIGVLVGARRERMYILSFGKFFDREGPFYERRDGRLTVHEGESLTNAAGHFEFSSLPSGMRCYALPQTGQVVWWNMRDTKGNDGALTEIEVQDIVLPTTTLYLFEFKDPDGQRIPVNRRIEGASRPTGQIHSGMAFANVTVQFYDEHGVAVLSKITQSPDLVARIAFAGDPSKISALRVVFPGYLPLFERLDEVGAPLLRPGVLRSYTLTPKLEILGRLKIWDDRPGSGHEPVTFALSSEITSVPPDRLRNGSGLGSTLGSDLKQGILEFGLSVLSNEAYWIHAQSNGIKFEPCVFGPFLPGDTVNEMELSFANEKVDRQRSSDSHEHLEHTLVPMRVLESDGEPALEGTSIRCGKSWGFVKEGGQGELKLFDAQSGPVSVLRRPDDGGVVMQVIESWQVDPVDGVEIHLQEWRTVELVIRGLSAARSAVAVSPQLHATELLETEWYASRSGALGTRLPDRRDGAACWRFLLGAGIWELRPGSPATEGLAGKLDVRDSKELQMFEFWME